MQPLRSLALTYIQPRKHTHSKVTCVSPLREWVGGGYLEGRGTTWKQPSGKGEGLGFDTSEISIHGGTAEVVTQNIGEGTLYVHAI